MIKIRIEATNPVSNEIDACEVVDTNFDAGALTEEFLDIFMRAIMGLSFTERQIEEMIINLADDFKMQLETQTEKIIKRTVFEHEDDDEKEGEK